MLPYDLELFWEISTIIIKLNVKKFNPLLIDLP
jgi:hypothetical protein